MQDRDKTFDKSYLLSFSECVVQVCTNLTQRVDPILLGANLGYLKCIVQLNYLSAWNYRKNKVPQIYIIGKSMDTSFKRNQNF